MSGYHNLVSCNQYCRYSDLATLKVEFTGRLRIYSASYIQEGTVLKAKVISTKLWDHVLDERNLPEEWVITYDEKFDLFEIKATDD